MSLASLSVPRATAPFYAIDHLSVTSPSLLLPCYGSPFVTNDKQLRFEIRPRSRCISYSKLRIQEFEDVLQNDLPVIKWQEVVDDETEDEQDLQISLSRGIKQHVDSIKSMLGSIEDGEISVSAYDTAWVALVPNLAAHDNVGKSPQFPSAVRWIADNQLPDGSWGDRHLFSYHDRLINTLACVVALRFWNLFPDKCEKGISFFRENMEKLGNEKDEQMSIGFEVAFPSLLEIARGLNIDVPYDSHVLQEIYAKKELKLRRIPRNILHKVPTTLLHSLEGMTGLDWEKLLKLQCQDGSFLFSPSSTAFALMQTQDENCLTYLQNAVQRFNGGVPNVYPVDMFERIWAVDRLRRLGISRHFDAEIRDCLDYVYRYWTEMGICWARYACVQDIDDTAMGFRVLRLYGYEVSSDVFRNFEKGGEFFCFAGQSTQAVTGIFNLYRASHLSFPGEEILENAKQFSSRFLRQKQEANQLVDKWVITKDLPGEIGCALEIPWFACLPRLETRFYIEHYGGEDDAWIGKTLYRMPYVNNNVYLELAKLDYNSCQALHQMEWNSVQKWYNESGLDEYGLSRRSLMVKYFLAAASIFEPERSQERLAWAKTMALVEAISSSFGETCDSRRGFVNEFRSSVNGHRYINGRRLDRVETARTRLVGTLLAMLNHISLDALVAHGRDLCHHPHQAWEEWMMRWEEGGERHKGEGELMVKMISLSSVRPCNNSQNMLSHPHFHHLSHLTNSLCLHLSHYKSQKVKENWTNNNGTKTSDRITTQEIETNMKQLLKLVLQRSPPPSSSSSSSSSSGEISPEMKDTFLTVARSFYYDALFDLDTINFHIAKVLFERVN